MYSAAGAFAPAALYFYTRKRCFALGVNYLNELMKAVKQHFISLSIFLAIMFGITAVFAHEASAAAAETNTEETTTTETETEETEEVVEEESTDDDSSRPTAEERAERQEERQNAIDERREEVQNNIEERKAAAEERREEIQNNIAERREALSERSKERIVNLAANVSNRLDAAVERMQNIIDRINTRIAKLQDRGVDTSEAESHMNDAQDAVDAAKAQLENIDTVVSEAVTAEDPRTAWQNAKTEFLAIKENIKSAHASLRLAVSALKAAVVEVQNDTDDTDEEEPTDTE